MLILLSAWIFGDGWFLMIAANICMLLPLIENKRAREYDKLNAIINKNIDKIIITISYIGRIEKQKKA